MKWKKMKCEKEKKKKLNKKKIEIKRAVTPARLLSNPNDDNELLIHQVFIMKAVDGFLTSSQGNLRGR